MTCWDPDLLIEEVVSNEFMKLARTRTVDAAEKRSLNVQETYYY